MSPRTGRPRKNEQVKNVALQIKITAETAEVLQDCAVEMQKTRTEVIEKGIELVKAELDAKK